MSALTDAIYQNTAGNSQGSPLGLSWDTGIYGTHTETPAPAGFSAVTGWGVVYPEAGASVSPNAATDTVQIANFTTYVHLTNGTWVQVQNQAQDGVGGAHYVADFSGNANIAWHEQKQSDGSVTVDAPPSGYNDHFYPNVRGTFAPGTVDGVFVEADMKTNDPSANLVAQIGADWWLSSTAPYANQSTNPPVGGGDFVKLTTQYQTVYFSSLSAAQLSADPPPGLTTTSSSGGTSSSGTSSSGTTTGSTTGSTSTGSTSSGSTSASGGTSSGGHSSSGTTTGSTTGSTSTGSTSSGSTSASGGTSSGGTTVTNPTGGSSSGSTGGSTSTGSTSSGSTPQAPTLTVADHSLSVSPGGKVSLGLGVSVPHAGDNVSVNISGLPSYETITDKLDGKTFSGSSVTLTAAEVNSGLTLNNSYQGNGRPSAALTVTAHDATGTPTTSAAQTITVTDPPAVTTGSGSSTTSGGGTSSGGWHHHWWSDHHNAGATTGSGTSTTTSGKSSGQSQGGHSNIAQWFNDHPGFAHLATTLSEAGASKSSAASGVASTTGSTSSAGAKAYALLNQMLAGDFGHDSHFAQTATTALSAASHQQANLLTRPLH